MQNACVQVQGRKKKKKNIIHKGACKTHACRYKVDQAKGRPSKKEKEKNECNVDVHKPGLCTCPCALMLSGDL